MNRLCWFDHWIHLRLLFHHAASYFRLTKTDGPRLHQYWLLFQQSRTGSSRCCRHPFSVYALICRNFRLLYVCRLCTYHSSVRIRQVSDHLGDTGHPNRIWTQVHPPSYGQQSSERALANGLEACRRETAGGGVPIEDSFSLHLGFQRVTERQAD